MEVVTREHSSNIIYPTNKFQTPITGDLKQELRPKVYAELMEFINDVEFVKNLVAPDRPTIDQMPKDEDGYVIVDVTRPHILSDMDYFVQTRKHFLKYGFYTSARFSTNPNSEYMKFWNEEKRRSLEGYHNPATGEWIPGYLYFYWNFGRIERTVKHAENTELKRRARVGRKNKGGKVRADRRQEFPDIWEIDYFWFHYIEQAEEAGLYTSLLKCRGMGASFKASSMFNRNMFLIEGSKSYAFAYHDGYLIEDGLLDKTWVTESFLQNNTAFTKRKLISKPMHRKTGYKNKATNSDEGYLSEIIGQNTKNPNSARGKRGKLVIHEEAGSNKHLTKSWSITDKSLDDKGYVFGMQMAMGTGGDDKSDFVGLARLHYSPKGYSVYPIRNVFDKGASGTYSGFFMGEYMNRPGSYNSDGVCDVVGNLITIFNNRADLEEEIQDPDVIAQKKAEGAITPLEAIVSSEKTVFPKAEATARATELQANWPEISKYHYVGRVERDGPSARFIPDSSKYPLLEVPYVGKHADKAAVQIFKMPSVPKSGEIPSFRYIIGVDTIEDDDAKEGTSMFSLRVMDLWYDEIVATYTGRSLIAEDDYEIALSLSLMYNATINYENNLKGFYAYFKRMHALRYLADTPQIVLDKGFQKTRGSGNKSKGTRATSAINAWGRTLQASWARSDNEYYEKNNLEACEDIGYIREMAAWNSYGNFDRISAGNMLFIYREELRPIVESNKFNVVTPPSEYEQDSFFADEGFSFDFVSDTSSSTGDDLDDL